MKPWKPHWGFRLPPPRRVGTPNARPRAYARPETPAATRELEFRLPVRLRNVTKSGVDPTGCVTESGRDRRNAPWLRRRDANLPWPVSEGGRIGCGDLRGSAEIAFPGAAGGGRGSDRRSHAAGGLCRRVAPSGCLAARKPDLRDHGFLARWRSLSVVTFGSSGSGCGGRDHGRGARRHRTPHRSRRNPSTAIHRRTAPQHRRHRSCGGHRTGTATPQCGAYRSTANMLVSDLRCGDCGGAAAVGECSAGLRLR